MDLVARPLSAPMREFLEWVCFRPRTHADAIEAWASHCPRFTEWEDALDLGLIELEPGGHSTCRVQLTPHGRNALRARSTEQLHPGFPRVDSGAGRSTTGYE